jgi:tRNA-(ms[2]io[6]A)-hydroxylase
MTRRSIDLHSQTDPAWVQVILDNFDEFLQDHANAERKASALAMSLIAKYSDRTLIIPRLIDLAQEELLHFAQVYDLLARRGVTLVRDARDPYVNRLLELQRHGRDERFVDRLLLSSLIECRGAERFGIIAQHLQDPELKAFYVELFKAETKHGHVFVDLALKYFDAEPIYARLEQLASAEAEIVATLEWRPSLH